MKIGLTCYSDVGGSGILGTELGKKLAEMGHEVHFITFSPPVRLSEYFNPNLFFHEAEILDYPVFHGPPFSLSLSAKMAEIAEKVPLDILHVHYAIPHAASAFMAREMLKNRKIKVITTLHGTDITLVGSSPGFIPITRFLIEQSDGVTAVSKHLKDVTGEIFETHKEIEVIYNFVDTEEFRPCKDLSVRRKFALDDQKILIHISNFRPVKRTLNTIRVFDLIRKKIPSVLLMVGDGTDYYAVNRLVETLGIGDSVRFLGKQKAMERIIPHADLFVLNSVKESFGLAVLEAGSCGVPGLVTDIGGLPEVVVEGETGFICPPDDVEYMAEKGIRLLSDDDLLAKMKKQSRRRAVDFFDSERIVPQYVKYYEKICNF